MIKGVARGWIRAFAGMAGLGFQGCWLWGVDSRFRGDGGCGGNDGGRRVFFNAEGAEFAEVWVLHRGIGGRRGVVVGLMAGLMVGGGVFQRRGRGVRRGLGFASRDWWAAGRGWWGGDFLVGVDGWGGVGYSGRRDWFLVVFG